MQTRKFSKPAAAVSEAIKTHGDDRGYSCFMHRAPPLGDLAAGVSKFSGQCTITKPPEVKVGAAGAAMFIPIFGPLISAGLRSTTIDEMYAQLQNN